MKIMPVLIPARGNSKGIKDKNIVDINGIPMLAYSILAAVEAKGVGPVYVSSEDKRVLQIASKYGAIPIKRPDYLSRDTSTTESVVAHFFKEVKAGALILMQPTSPMVQSVDLEEGIRVYNDGEYNSLFSATCHNDKLIWDKEQMWPLNYDPLYRGFRQTRKREILVENGAFYIFTRKLFVSTGSRLGGKIGVVEMPYWRSFQVDDKNDLYNVRLMMSLKM